MKSLLADRISRIKLSATLAITARANQIRSEGGDILNLAAGEPDADTPKTIKEGAIAAIQAGKTKYTPVAARPGLTALPAGRKYADLCFFEDFGNRRFEAEKL